MNVDFLVVGQGISGTWLSYYLKKSGRSFLLIDDGNPQAASRLAAGIINPVTGRRHVEAWMVDELLPFAWNAYHEFGKELNIEAISEKSIIDFFPTPQMRLSFMQRVEEKARFVFDRLDTDKFSSHFHFELGAGEIKPVYIVLLDKLLPAWRNQLLSQQQLLEQSFETGDLIYANEKISYRDINADYIIFCDGHTATTNPYFQMLPFAPNKGEIIIAEIPGLPANHIYKKGMVLVPLSTPGLWWIGSDYKWEFENALPTQEFRERTENLLKTWVKVPFRIVDHFAGVRPATLERRPFVGLHPRFPNIGILNGMGTKGCSLAPFFAKQLCDLIFNRKTISREADIHRYRNILSK